MITPNITPLQFLNAFRTHQQCMEYLFQRKFPNGFSCRKCGHTKHTEHAHRGGCWECLECGYQETAKAGTVLHKSKVPLVKWFRAIYEITISKGGVSAVELQYKLGFGSYRTAWELLHKLRCAMGLRDTKYQVGDAVEFDAALFGHRVSKTQCKVYLAVESKKNRKGRPCAGFAKAQVVDSTNQLTAKDFVNQNIRPLTEVKVDGGTDLGKLEADTDVVLNAQVMAGNKQKLDRHLPWVHKVISNMKSSIIGTFHGVSAKYMQLYLDEYLYRFNRRWCREQLQLRLVNACIECPPTFTTYTIA
jgi:hypothetical protein